MTYQHVFTTVDTHTAGEPTRILTSGVPFLGGGSMAEKRCQLQEQYDFIRTALMHEPRGHADMFGAIVTAPSNPEADLGVIFMDNEGYLAMCGHGSIGVAAMALEIGLVPRTEPETVVVIDTPAGVVRAKAQLEQGRLRQITVQNVPAFLLHSEAELHVAGLGVVVADIAFGGNFFALVEAGRLGLEVKPEYLGELIRWGIAIREAANEQLEVQHPTLPHIRSVELVEFYEDVFGTNPASRNVVVLGQGQVDRSPCGTGTCARMAALHASGHLGLDETFINESILGTKFVGRLLRNEQLGPFEGVVPEFSGMAYVTGYHQFVLDPADPLGEGFLLSRHRR